MLASILSILLFTKPCICKLFSLSQVTKSVEATFAQQGGNYANSNYLNSHSIPADYFEYGSNGDQTGYSVSNILGNDNYWVSAKPASDSFHPEITFNFSKTVTLEAFLFSPAYRTRDTIRYFDGFPLKTNIYSSTNNGPYELKVVFSGEVPTSTSWSVTQFVFPDPIKCDKLKLEFVIATQCESFNQGNKEVIATQKIQLVGTIDTNYYTSTGVTNPYNTANYVNPRKLTNTDFTYTSSGDKDDKPIRNAFDDNSGTYWVSDIITDSAKSTITIDFKEVKTIDAFLYDTAYRTRYPETGTVRYFDGFPTKLNVYSSLTDTGDSFILDSVFEGNPIYDWTRIQFVFGKPVTCRRLKLEFYEVTDDESFSSGEKRAATSGITFLKYIEVPPPTPTPVATPRPTPTQSPLPAYLNLLFEKATGDYANSNYVNAHQLASQFYSATTNGDKSGNPLTNALDSDSRTFWVSSQPNSESFKAAIFFNFTKTVSLEAFLLNPAYHTRDPVRFFDGFPLRLNFYASKDGLPFQIVASFTGEKPTSMTWDATQFVFHERIQCDKLKVEFYNVTENDSFGLGNKTQAAANKITLLGNVEPDYLAPAATADSYNDPKYVAAHRVPITEFTYASNGDQSGYPIGNAFDRGSGTYWVAGTETSDTFKSIITIEFNQMKTIDAVLWDTAYRTRYPSTGTVRYFDGFPTKLNVYASTTTGDDSFVLEAVFQGEPVFPWMRIQFVFKKPLECRRLKFELVEVTEDGSFSGGKHCATAGDIIFVSSQEQLPDPTASPRPTPMATISASPKATSTPTASISMTPMPTETPMATPTQSPHPTPTASPSPDPLNMPFDEVNGQYADSNYVNMHQITPDYFEALSNGDKDGYPLSNAFNSDTSKFWVSGEPNSDSFKATVSFNFTKTVILEAFLYCSAYRTRTVRYFDGFPLRLNFYASNNDSPFELVASFTGDAPTSTTWSLTQFVFLHKIRCDKLKIEFFNVTENDSFGLAKAKQASAQRMIFIGEIVSDQLTSIGVQDFYNISDYVDSHLIPTTDFTYTSNGEKSDKPISNAFDGNSGTYWVANQATTESFKSSITINLKSVKTVDALLIDAAYRTRYPSTGTVRYYDGFPTKLNVYTSPGNNMAFVLDSVFVCEPHYPWGRIQFVFKKPVKCQRLRLEFAEVTADESFSGGSNTAVVGGITLLQEAELPPVLLPDTEGVIDVQPDQCNHKYRCDQNITEDKYISLNIKDSYFGDYKSAKDGGGINLINCGFNCERTNFTKCSSENGGGAIFFMNKLNYGNRLNLEKLNFTGCSAVFGGAAYVCSPLSNVNIRFCSFYDAELIPPGENAGDFYGGSALFMTVVDSYVGDLFFSNCQGTTIKAYPGFDYEPKTLSQKRLGSQKVVLINKCTFESSKLTEASIYYVRGGDSTAFNVVDCVFRGEIKDGFHFIEGKAVSKKAPKLFVSKCKFASSITTALDTDKYEEFMSIDLKDQEFEGGSIVKHDNLTNLKTVFIVAVSAAFVAVVALIAALVLRKRKNANTLDGVEMSVETSHDFSQTNLNSLNESLI